MKIIFYVFLAVILILVSTGCNVKKTVQPTREDSLRVLITKKTDTLIAHYSRRPPEYKLIKLKRKNQLLSRFGSFGEDLILALNRVDKKNFRLKEQVVIPDTMVKDFLYYSPFPLKVETAAYIPKMIIISQQIQAFAAYEFGCLVKWGAVSTGKEETPTKSGLFHTNWKAKETISTFNDEWDLKWYFNLDNFEGISVHQHELPGYPASHACARMTAEDAEWIYYWAEQWIVTSDEENVRAYGTPVIIYGEYEYEKPQIWKLLASEPEKVIISSGKMESLLSQYSGTILSRKVKRDSVIAADKRLRKVKMAKK